MAIPKYEDLAKQVAELKSALKPFVAVAESYVERGQLDRGRVWSSLRTGSTDQVTVADFERAKALLAKSG